MKKLFALILSCAMMLGLAATAFAEDTVIEDPDENGVYSQETEIEGTTQAPTIKVTVPTTGAVVINPYGMKYGDDDATDKIISATQFIKNESDVAISITVSVAATPSNDKVVLATSALKGTETTKSVFLYFEIVESEDGSTEPETWAAYNTKNTNQVVVGSATKPTTKAGVHVMDAGDEAATFAAFHLAGDVASGSTIPWSEEDTVSVVIAFTFNPVYTAPDAGDGN